MLSVKSISHPDIPQRHFHPGTTLLKPSRLHTLGLIISLCGQRKWREEGWALPVMIKLLILLLAVVLSLPWRRVRGSMNRKRNNCLHSEHSDRYPAMTKVWFIWMSLQFEVHHFVYKNHFRNTETSQMEGRDQQVWLHSKSRSTGCTAALLKSML